MYDHTLSATDGHTVVTEDERLTERIGKLFAKADSVAGTPEAEVFSEKAYALLARHGIDEVLARARGGGVGKGDGGSDVEVVEVAVRGAYRRDQVHLVSCIVLALHCQAVVAPADRSASQVVTVVGARRHARRVQLLAGHLCALMLASAARSRPADPRVPTTSHRKSFMAGFAWEVHERLTAAEDGALAECADSGAAALVLADDDDRARAELTRRFPWTRPAPRRRVGLTGLAEGRDAASGIDLGQTRVEGQRRAIAG